MLLFSQKFCSLSLLLSASACAAGSVSAGLEGPLDLDGGVFDAQEVSPADTLRRSRLNGVIRNLGNVPVADPTEEFGVESPAAPRGDFMCTTRSATETENYSDIVAYGVNSESLWPGALLHGNAVQSGTFTQVVLPRAPLRASISLPCLEGGSGTIEMQQPSLSSYRDAYDRAVGEGGNCTPPANTHFEIKEVYSENQLSIALGANVQWSGGELAAAFNFRDEEVHTRRLVKFTQQYFTVDADQPSEPADFFDGSVSAEQVQASFADNDPAVYVSSMTYGRMVLFAVESTRTAQEVDAALAAAYRAVGVSVEVEAEVHARTVLRDSHTTAYILGGDSEAATRAIDGYDALVSFIRNGGNFSTKSLGAPIAYKLAHLSDNSLARLSLTSEYEITTCERVKEHLRVRVRSIEATCEDDICEVFGTLSVNGRCADASEAAGTCVVSGVNLINRTSGTDLAIRNGGNIPGGSMSLTDWFMVDVDPHDGAVLEINADLKEWNFWDDDEVGGTVYIPYELGWRRDSSNPYTLRLYGEYVQLIVTLEFEPN